METFDCPKCGAPVSYEPNSVGNRTARCAYCQSQLAVPNELRGEPARVISQIDIRGGRQITTGSSKWIWFLVLVPIIIVVIVLGSVFGALAPLFSKKTNATGFGGSSSSNANDFAQVVMKFGSEGIGAGMMKDARSIAVDGAGRIYVGEYLGGRVQVFDSNGKFITQWMVDPKMPLRALAADRKGTVYVVQRGKVMRFEGETGKPSGEVQFSGGDGFDDVITTPDGGLLCAWYRGSDDIVRFSAEGKLSRTIRAAISSASGDSELKLSDIEALITHFHSPAYRSVGRVKEWKAELEAISRVQFGAQYDGTTPPSLSAGTWKRF